MSTRFINCEVCQTEGRILTNDGGPDDVDHGVCPECNGERVVEIECEPITLDDLPSPYDPITRVKWPEGGWIIWNWQTCKWDFEGAA